MLFESVIILTKSIVSEEFQRAVKVSTGTTLDSHIVDTVFNIFDVDGDGHLSYREFISIMKDRMHRGSKVRAFILVEIKKSILLKFFLGMK